MKWILPCLFACSSLLSQGKEPISNYQALFSPRDHLADELISMIDKERKSIKVAVYCLTHRGLVKALTQAQERGVAIEVIIDPASLKAKTVLKQMTHPPFSVFIWNPPSQFKELKGGKKVQKRKSLMHDKFCILGDDRVWTGSFNFTLDASAVHCENVLVVENKEIASSYLAEFERIKRSGCVSLETYLTDLKSGKDASKGGL